MMQFVALMASTILGWAIPHYWGKHKARRAVARPEVYAGVKVYESDGPPASARSERMASVPRQSKIRKIN